MAAVGLQVASSYRLIVCLQNLFAGETIAKVSVNGPANIEMLQTSLAGGAVIMAVAEWELGTPDEVRTQSIQVGITTDKGPAGAEMVGEKDRLRGTPRNVLSTQSRETTFALISALAGHGELGGKRSQTSKGPVFMDSLGRLSNVVIGTKEGKAVAHEWRTRVLWETNKPLAIREVAQLIMTEIAFT